MSEILDGWIETESSDVRNLAAAGFSARQIARRLGCPLAAVLSAAPDLFQPTPETRAKLCECGAIISDDATRCRGCAGAARSSDVPERVRVMLAAGMGIYEIADELGIDVVVVRRAQRKATQTQGPRA